MKMYGNRRSAAAFRTAPYPTVKRVAEACLALEPVARAHPLRQPGAPQQ